jgi:hypothetical protein
MAIGVLDPSPLAPKPTPMSESGGHGGRRGGPSPSCSRCGVPLAGGTFVVTIAYRSDGADSPPTAESSARFGLCAACAEGVARWVADDPAPYHPPDLV